MSESGWGPVEDLVGTASARLLALGLPRHARFDALRLLGLLSDHTDREGRVRLPFDLLVAEFDLDPVSAERALFELEAVGVVRRQGTSLTLAAREPERPGGLRLADFLALTNDPAPELPVLPPPAPAQRHRRPKAVLALAGLALLLVAALTPGAGRPNLPTDLAAGDRAPAVAAPAGADTEASLGGTRGDRPAESAQGAQPGADPTAPDGPADEAGDPVPFLPPLVHLPNVDLPKLVACPADIPTVAILHGDPQASEDGPDQWSVVATGILRNPTTATITVDGVDVAAGSEAPVPAFEGSLTLAPGAEETWTVTVPAGSVPTLADGVTATLGAWRWADPAVAAACPVA